MSKLKTPLTSSSSLIVPISIVLTGLIIAGAVLASGGGQSSNNVDSVAAGESNAGHNAQRVINPDSLRPPRETDHMRGNPDAEVTIIEFSDFECPFCGRLHPTIERVVAESENVKWVYRHFPLGNHQNAIAAAVASECAAKIGGNDAFWDFSDLLFQNQRQLGTALYEQAATNLGIDIEEFRTCQESPEIANIVREDLQEVQRVGGTGTPYSILITASGQLVPFSGALPYATVKALVEQAEQS